jgi:uncharacterized protein YecT (DUF1311 family)
MKLALLTSALLAFLALGAAPAHADAANPRDVAALTQCLKGKETPKGAPESCIETVASPCFKGEEASTSDHQVTECFDREQVAWDQLLNDAYARLRAKLDETQQGKLRDMQRAWIADRKLTCDFLYDYFQGTMANPMIANCTNRETARRAILLRGYAADAKSRG